MKLYTCWICPFAQRVAISFAETVGRSGAGISGLITGVEQVEIDLKNKPEWYPSINPLGKVPALETDDGRILVESAIIAEYVIEKFGQDKQFFGHSLEDKADVRIFTGVFGDSFTMPFYSLLKSSKETRAEAIEKLDNAIRKELNDLLVKLSPSDAFVIGNKFGYADIICAPFLARLPVVEHYVGYKVPSGVDRFEKWRAACMSVQSVKATTATNDELFEAYKGYASKE